MLNDYIKIFVIVSSFGNKYSAIDHQALAGGSHSRTNVRTSLRIIPNTHTFIIQMTARTAELFNI